MAAPSPPKPWERAAGTAGVASASSLPSSASSAAVGATSTAAAPALPARPSTLDSVVNRTASNYASPYGSSMATSSYGLGGGMSSYSSPYSRLGGAYGGMGSMYGGYGGMGGGYGSMYGGMNPYGMGAYGMGGEQGLVQSFGQSTQATFQIIESIVGAFGGFAQMLQSTYMATHSSFFAMVSVAEQFGNLRNTLGSIFGIFAILRWVRTAFAKLTGRPLPASSTELTPASFAHFNGVAPDGTPLAPRASKKPFIMFVAAVFGLPYLMAKLIRTLERNREEEEARRIKEDPYAYSAQSGQPLDPSRLDFCRVMYDFAPDSSAQNVQGIDLAVRKGDLVAVLSKSDPTGNPSEWWLCRARDGRKGYLPAPYLQTIKSQQRLMDASQSAPVTPAGSRAQTLTSEAPSHMSDGFAAGLKAGVASGPAFSGPNKAH